MSKGWIKLYRSLIDWQYYDDKNATRLLVHLLLTVNYEQKRWKGIIIEPGSRVFSWDKLSNETGLTVQEVRTAMSKLKRSLEVTTQSTNRFSIVTLVKWEQLQLNEEDINNHSNKPINNPTTSQQQANNKQITTTKESNKLRNEEREEIKNYSEEVENCFKEVLEHFPETLHPKTNQIRQKWLETIEKLHRIDKIPFYYIVEITKLARSDDFWSKNFLSITKLRKKNREQIPYIQVFHERFKPKPKKGGASADLIQQTIDELTGSQKAV